MRTLSLVLLPFAASLISSVSAQCPGSNGQVYSDSNGGQYKLYCGSDTSPGSFKTSTAASFDGCMTLCDQTTGCTAVTYASGGTCYLKKSFTTATTNSGLNSAVRYVPITYPAPLANYVNASSGCGNPLPSGQTAGAASTTVNFTAPDGRIRSYLVHIPATYDVNKAAPLIMSFHGRLSTAAIHEGETGWSTPSFNPYGIVVYPQGVNVRKNTDGEIFNSDAR